MLQHMQRQVLAKTCKSSKGSLLWEVASELKTEEEIVVARLQRREGGFQAKKAVCASHRNMEEPGARLKFHCRSQKPGGAQLLDIATRLETQYVAPSR